MRSSGKFSVEAWLCFARSLTRFQRGAGNGGRYLGGQAGPTSSWACTQASLQIFIDVRKAYNSLDRGRCIEVLRGYGMGLNLARLFKSYWDHHRIFPNMDKFLRKDFRTGRKVTQGEPELSMIFNIVVNAVVWAVLDVVYGPQDTNTDWYGRLGEVN